MVEVVEEEVRRVDSLLQAALDAAPLGGGHDARHEVERENLFRAGALSINVEGDAHLKQRTLSGLLAVEQFAFGQALDIPHQRPRRGARLAVLTEPFVEEWAGEVTAKIHKVPPLSRRM